MEKDKVMQNLLRDTELQQMKALREDNKLLAKLNTIQALVMDVQNEICYRHRYDRYKIVDVTEDE